MPGDIAFSTDDLEDSIKPELDGEAPTILWITQLNILINDFDGFMQGIQAEYLANGVKTIMGGWNGGNPDTLVGWGVHVEEHSIPADRYIT